jgi:sugar phosphate permease
MSRRGFWAALVVALAGAFTGGTGGAFVMNRWGWETPYVSAVTALFMAGFLLVVYMKIRELPEVW